MEQARRRQRGAWRRTEEGGRARAGSLPQEGRKLQQGSGVRNEGMEQPGVAGLNLRKEAWM